MPTHNTRTAVVRRPYRFDRASAHDEFARAHRWRLAPLTAAARWTRVAPELPPRSNWSWNIRGRVVIRCRRGRSARCRRVTVHQRRVLRPRHPGGSDVVSASHRCVRSRDVVDCVRGQFDVPELAVSRAITGAGAGANTRTRARTITRASAGTRAGTSTRARARAGTSTRARARAGTTPGRAGLVRYDSRRRFHAWKSSLRARRAGRCRRHDRDMDEHGLGRPHLDVRHRGVELGKRRTGRPIRRCTADRRDVSVPLRNPPGYGG